MDFACAGGGVTDLKEIAYFRPRSLEEALSLCGQEPGRSYLAGGTDLLVKLRRATERPRALVSLRGIPDLRRIELGDPFRIGAGVTVAELASRPEIAARYPLLGECARALGTPQIREVATVGGNLCNCSPCADTAPALLVYGARLVLRGKDGAREVEISDFLRGPGQSCLRPGELLVEIRLPAPLAGARTVYQKKGRVKADLALASLAALVVVEQGRLSDVRLAAGSVAPVCLRLARAEGILRGRAPEEELLRKAGRAAAEEISPIDDVRASADYRRRLIEVFVRRAVAALAGEERA